jgi:hypothetical protein
MMEGARRDTIRGDHFMRVLTTVLVALMSVLPVFAGDTYVRATVGEDGQLRILTAGGQTIAPKKDVEQVGFGKPQISPDGVAVGWLAEYRQCCTSYPIPLKLMIHSNGSVRTFTGRGLPIMRWGFQAGGAQVAFEQEIVPGGMGVHYELHDVATGRLLAQYDPVVGPDNRALPRQKVPTWVVELDGNQ